MSRSAIALRGDVHAVQIMPHGVWHLTRVNDYAAPLLCEFTPRLQTRWFNERSTLPLTRRCPKCWKVMRERITKGGL